MRFDIRILGSSSALPTKERTLSSQVVNLNEKHFMIDCGDGTQVQVRKYGVKFQRINHIFISHLHGDHFFGLIGLLSTMQLLGRTNPINIYCPEKLDKIINLQLKITDSYFTFPVNYHFHSKEDNQLLVDGNDYTIHSFQLKHRIPTWGFVFREKPLSRNIDKKFVANHDIPIDQFEKIKNGADFIDEKGNVYPNEKITIAPPKPRSFAYCSDTKYTESILPYISGVDLLYHEATFGEDKRKEADEKFHSTAKDAAMIAKKAKDGQLIIGHFSARYKDAEVLLNEAREIFPDTQLAVDGEVYKIKQKN